MTDTGCSCHSCNGKCPKPSDAQIEKMIERMLIASDVREAIESIGEPIAKWGFLGNYLAMKGVFE
jgi:hypothetical protein